MVRTNDHDRCRCIRSGLDDTIKYCSNHGSRSCRSTRNLDPAVLYGSAASIEKAVKAMLDDAYANGEKTGYVANLGHGITQWVDPAQPKIFVDTVHEYSAKYLG